MSRILRETKLEHCDTGKLDGFKRRIEDRTQKKIGSIQIGPDIVDLENFNIFYHHLDESVLEIIGQSRKC